MAEAEGPAAPVPDAPVSHVPASIVAAEGAPAPSVKDDNWRSVQPQPIREDQVQTAVNFLSHPKVKDSAVRYRRTFLERKGLSREEIDEAFRRVPDPPSSTTVNPLAPHETATQAAPPFQSYNAQQHPPVGQLALAPQERQQYRWTQMLLAVGLLASAGAGTGILVKKWLLPKLKTWIRHIALDEAAEKSKAVQTDEQDSSAGTNNISTATAVTTLAAAASQIALATQEMIRTRAEEHEARNEFIKAMEAQTKEVRAALSGMQEAYLDASRRGSPHGDRSMSAGDFNWTNRPAASTTSWEAQYAARNSTVKSARSGPATDFHKVVSNNGQAASQAPGRSSSVHAPHSHNYQEIIAMVKRGETPPGIRDVNDKPPNPEQLPSFPQLQPKQKPWEVAASTALRPADSSVGQSGRLVGEKPSLENGTAAVHSSPFRSETNESWWRQQKVSSASKPSASRIIELDSGGNDQETVESSNAMGIGHGTFSPEVGARGTSFQYGSQKWVPPPIPPSSLPGVVIPQRIQETGGSEQADAGYVTPEEQADKQKPEPKVETGVEPQNGVDRGSLQEGGVVTEWVVKSDGE